MQRPDKNSSDASIQKIMDRAKNINLPMRIVIRRELF